jgi:hypothetical protein
MAGADAGGIGKATGASGAGGAQDALRGVRRNGARRGGGPAGVLAAALAGVSAAIPTVNPIWLRTVRQRLLRAARQHWPNLLWDYTPAPQTDLA